ncbi:hypothetical protein BH09ACT12_BH09ACT12_22220 [soil metagenome]
MSALEIDDLNHDADSEPEEAAPTGQDASEIGQEAAVAAWAVAARPILENAARSYQSVVTQKELAAQVQEDSDVRTRQQIRHWIGDVLAMVTADCASRSEPLLSALCVNALGSVGDNYARDVEAATGVAPTEGDDHAAAQRLACYRQYEAVGLPEDGGFAALTPRLAGTRDRARKARLAERVVPTCPDCFMELAATGVCDNCLT